MRSKLYFLLFLCFVLCGVSQPGWAQGTLTVTGTVTDGTTGETLIGVNIKVKNGSRGCTTDIDGNYTLSGVGSKEVLVFSSIGYKTQEIQINGRTRIDLQMKEDSELLGEVVVIGYGTMDKKELTSAVAHVSDKQFLTASSIDPTMMIQGKVCGWCIHHQYRSRRP